MTLSVWEPLRTIDRFDRLIGNLLANDRVDGEVSMHNWRPAADTIVDDDGYLLCIDLPGVARDDIHISVEDGLLSVSAERTQRDRDQQNGRVYREEVRYGRFERAFRLPADADCDSVSANCNNGVLEIRIARSETAKARKIPIAHA